jgi:sec-independent protein translocase protein TatA
MPFVGHLPELVIVMLLALLIFGPKRLPEMGNAVGKTIKEFQKTMKDATHHEETPAAGTDRQIPAAPTVPQVTAETRPEA